MWIVRLVKPPKYNNFRSNFFPRRLYYKKDAEELKKEVESKGGEVIIEKEKK